ncbi:MAG: hypothetical protein AAB403_07110 [Planctomycetota bacterium]
MTHQHRDIATPQQWTREQIRAARRIELAPLLQKRGLALRDRGSGNMEVEQYRGLLLKESYWRWPDRDMAGNTIDFYVKVLGTSFSDAMKELMRT